jgi:hypothetical protein
MPKLATASGRLFTVTAKKPDGGANPNVVIAFTASHSVWTFANGVINLVASVLPYHSYGASTATNTPVDQGLNKTWPLRAGLNTTYSTSGTAINNNSLIGYALNGVSLFTNRSTEAPIGKISYSQLTWNSSYQAGKELGYTYGGDNAGGWSNPYGEYHYNDYSFASAWLTGSGHVDSTYGSTGTTETHVISYFNKVMYSSDGHSKLIGFAVDGYPIYGPKGYVNPTTSTSGVKYLQSGYKIDYVNTASGRIFNALYAQSTSTNPQLGAFCDDYYYAGTGDLDEHNGRYCITPEYPAGTYAYFMTVNTSTGMPVYPYIIGPKFKQYPVGNDGSGVALNDPNNAGGKNPVNI